MHKLIVPVIASLLAWPVVADDPTTEFKFIDGVCQNAKGERGLNLGVLGECGYARGLNLSGMTITLPSLRGADLRDVDFSAATLSDTDLTSADLDGSKWMGANVTNAKFIDVKFEGSVLGRSIFQNCEFNRADFKGATGQNATLTSSKFRSVDFSKGNLQNADFSYSSFDDSSFAKANLTSSKWMGTHLNGVHFDAAVLSSISVSDAIWTRIDSVSSIFTSATVENTRIESSDFTRSSWNKVLWSGVEFVDTKFDGSDFSQSHARGLGFKGVSATHSTWYQAGLDDLSMQDSDLSNSILKMAKFRWKTRDHTKMDGVVFTDAAEIGMTDAECSALGMRLFKPIALFYDTIYILTGDDRNPAPNLFLSVENLLGPGSTVKLHSDPSDFAKLDLQQFSAILIPYTKKAFTDDISAAAAAHIHDYIANGGTVVVFAGGDESFGKVPELYEKVFGLPFRSETSPTTNFTVLKADLTETAKTPFYSEPCDFVEDDYLAINPDVAAAIRGGFVNSGKQHYEFYGQYEGRQINLNCEVRFPPGLNSAYSQIWVFPRTSLPTGAHAIFSAGENVGAFWNPVGKGQVLYLGQIWQYMYPTTNELGGWPHLLGSFLKTL